MLKKIIISILIVLSISTVHAGLHIVKDGKSEYSIVTAPDALPITLRAAKDLQLYIGKSTNVKLPISRTGVTSVTPNIVVGDCEAARKAGINADTLKAEGFIIKTVGHNLFIVGKDSAGAANSDHWQTAPQSGTWNGVSYFLETFLDIRWFFPGEYGEYVPEHKNLSIGDIDFVDYPKMEYRRMSYLRWKGLSKKQIDDAKDWKRRNKNGWSVTWLGSHSWRHNFKGEDFFKEHPEWFAMVNGRRLARGSHGLQMCTTNSQALDKFSEIIIKKSKENGGIMFSLSPNDGRNHCECEKCIALDVEKNPDGTPVLTDRYVTYCNEIAKRVNKVLPNQTFGFYSYSYYANPPRKTKLDPHVKVMHVRNGVGANYYTKKESDEYLNKKLLPWKKAVKYLYFYTHPSGMGNLTLPSIHPHAIKNLYIDLAKANVTGFSMNNAEAFDGSGLNNYLYLKMAWNPEGDFDKIYQDAIAKCYGSNAAPYVLKYIETLEKAVKERANNLKIDIALGSARRFPDIFDDVYDGLYEKGMPFLKKAANEQADKGQKYRLQMVIDNLEYCRDAVALHKLSKKVLGSSKANKKDIVEALALAGKVLVYQKKLAKLGRLSLDRVESTKKTYNIPFSPKIYHSMLKQLEGGTKKAYATMIQHTETPKIDGSLKEPFWNKLKPLNVSLDKNTGDDIGPGSQMKIAYDKDNIYIGIVCNEPMMNKINDSCVKADGAVWNENDVEIFFDTKNRQKAFKQLCINTLGTVADLKFSNGKGDLKWNSEAKIGVFKGDKYWSMEIQIPLKNLTDSPLKPGDIWGFNLCRVRRTVDPSQYTCWIPTFGGFKKPARFGKLIFK